MTETANTFQLPKIGAPAPDFTLASTTGQRVTLSHLRGKQNVILAFFPLAFTSVCSLEMTGFHDDVEKFEESGTKVFGISVDSIPSLNEFQFKLGIKTEMLSDFRREVSRLYGVLNEERYTSRRSYFLIDKEGLLRWLHVETQGGQKRENQELLEEIAKLG